MGVLVGCSGWSYDDWAGCFYPSKMNRKKWLKYYQRYYHTVEINSTYYRVPSPRTVQGWIEKGEESFEYSLKLPQTVTHKEILGDQGRAVKLAARFEERVIEPIAKADCFGAALIQLTPYLEYPGGLEALETLFNALDTGRFDYVVEFRHDSWARGDGLEPRARQILEDYGVACCVVDGPGFPPIMENTANHTYIRFHGRRGDIWFEEREGMERYNYEYSEEELGSWARRIGELEAKTVRVYFNNHPLGKAPKNAMMLMSLLDLPGDRKNIKIQEQTKLGFY